jgi:hypothetical protein
LKLQWLTLKCLAGALSWTLWSVNESPEDSSHSELLGFFGHCPSSSILENRKCSILETGSIAILRWGKTLRKSYPQSLDQMMDKIQKHSNSEYYTPSSEPFRIHLFIPLLHILESFSYAVKIWYEAFILGVLRDMQVGQWSLNHGRTVGLPCLFSSSVKELNCTSECQLIEHDCLVA